MFSALSIYIDTKEKKLYFIEFSDILNFEKSEVRKSFSIKKTTSFKNTVTLIISDRGESYKMYIERKEDNLYKIEMDSIMLNSDFGRYEFYMPKSQENKLLKEDCGDFDG